jgi:hypothetical protein
MEADFSLPSAEQIQARITLCRVELAELKRALRAIRATEKADQARQARAAHSAGKGPIHATQ